MTTLNFLEILASSRQIGDFIVHQETFSAYQTPKPVMHVDFAAMAGMNRFNSCPRVLPSKTYLFFKQRDNSALLPLEIPHP